MLYPNWLRFSQQCTEVVLSCASQIRKATLLPCSKTLQLSFRTNVISLVESIFFFPGSEGGAVSILNIYHSISSEIFIKEIAMPLHYLILKLNTISAVHLYNIF